VIKFAYLEPTSYKQAVNSPEKEDWLKAMSSEIQELENQNIWSLVELLKNRTALGGRWVYKKKPTKFKAKWVAQCFNQVIGLDYLDTFSTTYRPKTYRIVFIIALILRWAFLQFDVKNAYVHTDVDKEIYVIQPTRFEKNPKNKNFIYKLNKALYGLKQSPRLWYKFLKACLLKAGFIIFPYNEGCFIHPKYSIILLCYVNDIIAVGPNPTIINKIILLKACKNIKLQALGEPTMFLGLEMDLIQGKSLKIHQTKYTISLLTRFNKESSYKYSTLCKPGVKLQKATTKATASEIQLYQQQIGGLLYLTLKTRPDINYAVN